MSETALMLHDLCDRLLSEQCSLDIRRRAETGEWPESLWNQLERAGLPVAAVDEHLGGAGASLSDTMTVVRAAGRHAVPLPLVESIVANWLLARMGHPVLDGPLSVAPTTALKPVMLKRKAHGWVLSGSLPHVPWGRYVKHVVVIGKTDEGRCLALPVPREACRVEPANNVATEPRDRLSFDDVFIAHDFTRSCKHDVANDLMHVGALARCQQMAGAAEWILDRSCTYVRERSQFGRSIGSFQAVQHLIARLAEQVSAAAAACDGATYALEAPKRDHLIAFAKSSVGESSAEATAIAHQVHGAMGYSHEYPLHFRTRRIWSWRESLEAKDFGNCESGDECRLVAGLRSGIL